MSNRLLCLLTLAFLFQACSPEKPSEATSAPPASPALTSGTSQKSDTTGMALIPAGTLQMGGDNEQADPNEYPKHPVKIDAFYLDKKEVTNQEFKAFVDETGYVTVAERAIDWEELKSTVPPGTPKPPDSLLQPGALVFQATNGPVPLDNVGQWWQWTIGANWRHPEGPGSSIEDRMDHPVVQIAWEDAEAYAKWAGKRLPTEAEWEWAARGGKEAAIYPWGNEPVGEGAPKANYWEGFFPYENTEKDGYFLTAPVGSYEPNGYGLYDMAGNVWEWCSDWYDYDFYKKPASKKPNPESQQAWNPTQPYQAEKVLRGGSFLCNDSYCSGYRNARRMSSSPDTGLNHTGFRCARSL